MNPILLAVVLPIIVTCYTLLQRSLKVWRATAWEGRSHVFRELGIGEHEKTLLVGIFHPYCNAGGGGERVLWTAVAHLQRTEPDVVILIYTGDTDASKEDIILKVKERFNITLDPRSLSFIFIKSRYLIEDTTWKRFTLLGQSIGSMFVGLEALSKVAPDIFIDTMGYAFTYPVVSLLSLRSIPIGAYVHYPTISTDMLERVKSRKQGHTNNTKVAASWWRSGAKLMYYRLFALLYSWSLRQADAIVVNSSWTKNHVDSLLAPRKSSIVYPPCDMEGLKNFPLEGRESVVLSVAQFRPEKEYPTQIQALHNFLSSNPQYRNGPRKVRLVMVGSSRNEADAARVKALRQLADHLGVNDNVEFVINAPYDTLTSWLSRASVGISTMVDEHFGINVVEYMASGLIPLVHASGGPLHDIVIPIQTTGEATGFHSTSPESYAHSLEIIFGMSEDEQKKWRGRARTTVERFGRHEFEASWAVMWGNLKQLAEF